MNLTKICSSEVKAHKGPDSPRTVTATISTATVDRDGDVVLPSGLDLKAYRKNPVVHFAHDTRSLPIGVTDSVVMKHMGIQATIRFAERPKSMPDAQEWMPDTIHELFQQGILRAFSVGFTVPKGGLREATQKDKDRHGETVQRVITKWSLHELSVVPVPANPEALATAVSKGILPQDSLVYGRVELMGHWQQPPVRGSVLVLPLEEAPPLRL